MLLSGLILYDRLVNGYVLDLLNIIMLQQLLQAVSNQFGEELVAMGCQEGRLTGVEFRF